MRFLKQFFALIFLLTIEHSQAAGKFYTQQEFDTLLAEGKTLVVHIHADWCGTYKSIQLSILLNLRMSYFLKWITTHNENM